MTTPDATPSAPPAPPAPPAAADSAAATPPAAPAAPRRASAVPSVIAFGLGLLLTVLYLVVKLLSVSLNFQELNDGLQVVVTTLGVLGLVSLLPILLVVALGHVGARAAGNPGRRGRILAGFALGLGYFHLLMWGNRLLVAAIAAASLEDPQQFIPGIFWWA